LNFIQSHWSILSREKYEQMVSGRMLSSSMENARRETRVEAGVV
jgi:hypothetical protein